MYTGNEILYHFMFKCANVQIDWPTCIGLLIADMAVNPTISLKYIVTHWYASASTLWPRIRSRAMLLELKQY